jgi:hypothetical protein
MSLNTRDATLTDLNEYSAPIHALSPDPLAAKFLPPCLLLSGEPCSVAPLDAGERGGPRCGMSPSPGEVPAVFAQRIASFIAALSHCL